MKQRILNLIALRPNIRVVEISDALDIDMELIRPMIKAEIGTGMIVVGTAVALNGLIVETFRSAVQAPVVERKAAPTIAKPVAAVKAAVKPVAAVKPSLSKVDAAIAYLRENGPVPTEFLSRAMGLKKGEYPSQYLSAALRDGRVICENKDWSAGPIAGNPVLPAEKPETDPVPALAAKEVPAPVTIPRFTPEVAESAVTAEKAPLPAPVVAATMPKPRIADPAAARFVAGLMSNGELMIDVDGKITTLTHDQAKTLHAYLGKIGYVLLP